MCQFYLYADLGIFEAFRRLYGPVGIRFTTDHFVVIHSFCMFKSNLYDNMWKMLKTPDVITKKTHTFFS